MVALGVLGTTLTSTWSERKSLITQISRITAHNIAHPWPSHTRGFPFLCTTGSVYKLKVRYSQGRGNMSQQPNRTVHDVSSGGNLKESWDLNYMTIRISKLSSLMVANKYQRRTL